MPSCNTPLGAEVSSMLLPELDQTFPTPSSSRPKRTASSFAKWRDPCISSAPPNTLVISTEANSFIVREVERPLYFERPTQHPRPLDRSERLHRSRSGETPVFRAPHPTPSSSRPKRTASSFAKWRDPCIPSAPPNTLVISTEANSFIVREVERPLYFLLSGNNVNATTQTETHAATTHPA